MGDVSSQLLNENFSANHLMLYNILLGYDARLIGYALSATRILDAFTDPLVGQLSDNTRTRWGRRRPYVLFGGILSAVVCIGLWTIPGGLTPASFFLLFLATYLVYSLVSKCAFIPHGALGLEISIEYHERTRVQAYRTFFSTLIGATLVNCSFYFATRPIFGSAATGLRWVSIGYALLSILFFWAVFAGTREEAEVQAQPRIPMWTAMKATLSNGPFLIILASLLVIFVGVSCSFPLAGYVALYYVFEGDLARSASYGMVGGLISEAITIVLLPAFTAWAVRSEKKRIYIICATWLAVTFLGILVIYHPKYPYLTLVFSAVSALPMNGINLTPGAMLADVCDYDELRTGFRREGVFNAMLSLIGKACMVFPPVILGWTIFWVGFVPGALEQSPETIHAMRWIAAIVPAASIAVAAALVVFYPLTEKRVRDIRAQLEARRAERLGLMESPEAN